MRTISGLLRRVIRAVLTIASSVLPGPPSDESAPPDIDGRRPSDVDTTAIDVDIQRKAGKGGLR